MPTSRPLSRRTRKAAAAATALALCLALTACGSAGSSKPSASSKSNPASSAPTATDVASTSQVTVPASASPETIIAHVGNKPIRFATVSHLMAIKSAQGETLPDPPGYQSCIARLKAKGGAEVAKKPEAELKQACREAYEGIVQSAISTAVHNQWLLGEAAELGIDVSPSEIQHEFDLSKKSFKSQSEFESYRKGTGESLPDMRLGLKLGKLTDKIFQKIKQKEHPATSAQVAAYYAAHRSRYTIPEGRDVRILRTTTKAVALRAKQELQSGKSFATVVKELSTVGQPITAKNGEIANLSPTLFAEKSLNDPIFSAQLNRLYGPVRVIASHKDIAPESGSGYFIFEVKGIVPASQTPLGAVRNSIAEELTKAQREQTISSFVKAFRRKWTARSDCEPGYVALDCRQFKVVPKKGVPEDYFTL